MKKNRKSDGGSLPLSMRTKKYKMLFGYHLRGFWRKRLNALPFTLFTVSLILFISILVPNFAHRLSILGEWPRKLTLCGSVFVEVNDPKYPRRITACGATVEIGGYKSKTGAEGEFEIKFVSEPHINIPVIISWSGITVIERVSFEANEFKKTNLFIVYEK